MNIIYKYDKGKVTVEEREVVGEYPLVLEVNGREIATLIGSSHDLHFLAAGFLRLQGMVEKVEEIEDLSICNDYGIARVKIKGEVPEKLKPVLTSGCGTGISFTIPQAQKIRRDAPFRKFSPATIFSMMDGLAQRASAYQSHGGIHSAAVGHSDIVLYAEDLGRHNTLDRIAGEALLTGVDTTGMIMVTSGRISTEAVAKAALMGIEVMASRTSPTQTAIRMATDAGITLIGYVRAQKFEIYSHVDRLEIDPPNEKISGVTGVILAGGASTRMGSNKALLLHKDGRIIEGIYRILSELFEEVIVVTNDPQLYAFLPCRKVPDIHQGKGVLAGIHSGLQHSANQAIFTVACDMPQLNRELIRHLITLAKDVDLVMPKTPGGFEPLHAYYGKGCLPALERLLDRGERRVLTLFEEVPGRVVSVEEVAKFDPNYDSFVNINTPDDYYKLRNGDPKDDGTGAKASNS